jgi:CRISPR/Cas system-associated endonuclease Cas1
VILEGHFRTEIIAKGYDPTLGYLHTHQKDRAALVFSLMEPLRPVLVGKFAATEFSNTTPPKKVMLNVHLSFLKPLAE